MTWPIVKLGDVCTFTNGGTPSKEVTDFWCGEIPWISSADIVNDAIQKPRHFITAAAVNNSSTNQVPAGTLLVVTRTGVGKVAITDVDLCFSQDITALHLNTNCYSKYIAYAIKSHSSSLIAQARGATIKGITRDVLASLPISLPPFAEQQRIAAILDKTEEIRRKRELAIAKLDELEQSVFQDIARRSTQFISLNEVADFKSGGTPSKDNKEFWNGDIAWISSADIVNDEIAYGRNYITNAGLTASATSLASKGTILVVTRTGIGKVAITNRDTCFSQDIVALSLKQEFETTFVASAIKANKNEFLRQARGATIQGITKAVLGKALVPIISLDEQRKFTQLSNSINSQRKKLISHVNDTSKLISSLQHQAFTTGFNA